MSCPQCNILFSNLCHYGLLLLQYSEPCQEVPGFVHAIVSAAAPSTMREAGAINWSATQDRNRCATSSASHAVLL